tara:strand:+ start:134 stop:253 length:120 start_codon:yes stop_codon:yes gene_type:complete
MPIEKMRFEDINPPACPPKPAPKAKATSKPATPKTTIAD